MKELLSSFAVAVGAVCFGLFVTVFKPDSIRAVPEPSRPAYCKVAVRTAHDCHGQGAWSDEVLDEASAARNQVRVLAAVDLGANHLADSHALMPSLLRLLRLRAWRSHWPQPAQL